jgi:hypothetical protein
VNERNLSRSLSTSIVDALKSQGHILVVKGGATALARELEELMMPGIATIAPRIQPFMVVGGEITSTFGSEAADEAVEDLVLELTAALMDSDHVEDVFAEDNVIRRDIFRALREGLLRPPEGAIEPDEEPVKIKLETLGYVAATVSKLCDVSTLRDALGRAAEVAEAHFTAYSAEEREATFTLEDGDPDGRLELEEAIADELTDLVEHGEIELPTIDRSLDLGRALSPIEQRIARGTIDAIAQRTLLRTGCAATWELETPRTIKVIFTPLSEHDGREVDDLVSAFANELRAWLGGTAAANKPARAAAPAKAAPARAKAAPAARDDEDDLDEDDLDDEDEDDLDDEDEDDLDDEDEDDLDDEERDSEPEAREEEPAIEAPVRRATRAKEPRAQTTRAAAARAPKRAAPKRAAPKRAAPKQAAAPSAAAEPEKRARPKAKTTARKASPEKHKTTAPAKVRKTPEKKR